MVSLSLFHQHVPTVVHLVTRAKDKCDDDDSSSACQKPETTDALTVGLAVAIPVFVVGCGLGYLLWRGYRKNKKESMEHDPDFDENGEATALPDFPNKNATDDPFSTRNSARFPIKANMASSASLPMSQKEDPYLDNFVLPYQHQTGLKLSLDEYARNIGASDVAFTPRGSYVPGHTARNSLNVPSLGVGQTSRTSPQKSALRSEVGANASPTKSLGRNEQKYTNLPNTSTHSFNPEKYYESSELSSGRDEKFAVQYENEKDTSDATYDTTHEVLDKDHPEPTVTDDANFARAELTKEAPAAPLNSVESPFEDRFSINRKISSPADISPDKDLKSSPERAPEVTEDLMVDGDFEFTNGSEPVEESTPDATTHEVEPEVEPTQPGEPAELAEFVEQTTLDVPHRAVRNKSPRISAFNLLQNDSDDEDLAPTDKPLSPEQDEELKRMKSVYKVYFDRENSVKRDGERFEDRYEFNHDESQPLPELEDHLRINRDLNANIDYDKRMTTTSSIYNDTPIFSSEEQQYYNQQYYVPQGNSANTSYSSHNTQRPKVVLPPLQTLPSASDIRKSTIQTYTDFQPRPKGQVTSPTSRQPFNPIENDGVWTSPVTSPQASHPPTFDGYAPPLASNNSLNQVPSASQMARSSVVMLNPVTEITKLRKFKPAGSLPSGGVVSPVAYQNAQFEAHSNDDLIPGNRKSDLRRMMNTNF